MKLRAKLHRLLFGAESRLHDQTYTDLKREHERRHALEVKLEGLQLELTAAHALVAKWKPKAPRFDRYRAMDEDQIAEVLAGAGELPAMKAIMQMIDEKFQQASDEGRDPELPELQTKFHLGGAEWMLKLKQELQAALELERKPEARR